MRVNVRESTAIHHIIEVSKGPVRDALAIQDAQLGEKEKETHHNWRIVISGPQANMMGDNRRIWAARPPDKTPDR